MGVPTGDQGSVAAGAAGQGGKGQQFDRSLKNTIRNRGPEGRAAGRKSPISDRLDDG